MADAPTGPAETRRRRRLKGVYQHCAEKHLQRYINEFDFRYNTRNLEDGERAAIAHKQVEGKRLTYRRAGGVA